GDARQQITAAHALTALPGVAEALAGGSISWRHATVICDAVERIGADVVTDAEPILLDAAAALDPGRLNRVMAHLRHIVDPAGADADAAAEFERRGLYASPLLDGMVAVNGLLDPDTGAALLTAVNSGPPPTGDDRRSPAQRRADRLGEILRADLSSVDPSTAGGHRPHLTMTVDGATLRGERGATAAHLDWIGPIDAATARLIGCDCELTAVVVDEHGIPLNVGWRYRTATPGQRIELAGRDRHCQAPGCDRPPAWCDAHHVLGWYHGGRTDLSNLVLLCRRHHRAVHQGVWSIVDAGNGRFAFKLNRGTAGSNPAPPAERRRDAA
nr:DUF222 domain-containing protein [Geodermatophilaceae bacterium]